MGSDSTNVTKRHHTVPQFYLRGFAEGDKFATVKLPGDRRFVQSVRRAASQMNFYAIPGHQDGADVFEKMLAGVEGEASGVFAKVMSGVWPLSESDRLALAYFIAVQVSRGPEQRRNLEHLAAQVTRLEVGYGGRAGVKRWAKRKGGMDLSDEEAADMWEVATQPGGAPIRLSSMAHIKHIVRQAEGLTKYIAGRPWSLVEFNTRSLITSDVPVGLIPHPQDDDPWSGVGFMTAWGITFPLTRKLGLLMSDPMVVAEQVPVERVRAGHLDTKQRGTTALEKLFNERTTNSASIWLYHHPADGRFVPNDLPDASPVTSEVTGMPDEFSGEPLYTQRKP